MSELDSFSAQKILRNGALLIVPPMIITTGLWGALLEAFSPEIFWKDIPEWLGVFENVFRILAFSLPGILYFEKKDKRQSLKLSACFILGRLGWFTPILINKSCFVIKRKH